MEGRHHSAQEWTRWITRLAPVPRSRVLRSVERLLEHGPALGMPLIRGLGNDLLELRVGGHRLYFTVRGELVLFLTYGDKDSQARDIVRARKRMT